eukprot:TRINITY_DN16061_c0_g1_i1.p2 TRINITY_DN16061_c0_g1~~TRINITY_DN16061_c0_g1_i1.p2  ORF type:complete len:155 (+),score=33.04 TRINITY_DN16061_c0_g1_i1:574-1038(+)
MQATKCDLKQTLMQVYSTSGLKGFYRGLSLTIAREIPANVLYFWTFESVLSSYGYSMHDSTRYHNAPSSLVFLAGGAAGIANWLLVYPIDSLKTRFQSDNLVHPRYASVSTLISASTTSVGGWRSLFTGYSACLLRAFFANAATFVAIEAYRGS